MEQLTSCVSPEKSLECFYLRFQLQYGNFGHLKHSKSCIFPSSNNGWFICSEVFLQFMVVFVRVSVGKEVKEKWDKRFEIFQCVFVKGGGNLVLSKRNPCEISAAARPAEDPV